jgi:antitoxin component YwqK of YwqJK toxin-antitoxin module
MKSKDRVRLYLQILFFGSIVFTVIALYVLNKQKSKDGASRFFPDMNNQQRVDYYPNGQIRAVGNTAGFNKDGKWLYYLENGKLQLIEVYQNGQLISSEKQVK